MAIKTIGHGVENWRSLENVFISTQRSLSVEVANAKIGGEFQLDNVNASYREILRNIDYCGEDVKDLKRNVSNDSINTSLKQTMFSMFVLQADHIAKEKDARAQEFWERS